ncbi:MAG TPA: hypothetical protein VJ023_00145 [Pyrinomonadaceae bacterium]|nr:hypothetical protein [Pyrinomonadaceae bacterium]
MPIKQLGFKSRGALLCAVALFVLAFAARLTFIAANGPVLTPDSRDYILLAQNLRANATFSLDPGAGQTPTIRRAPLYPVLLMPFLTTGSIWTLGVVIFQSALDSLVTLLVLQLALWVVSLRLSFVAGLAYALHPGAIYFCSTVLSESLFTALLVGGVFGLIWAFRHDSLKSSAGSGVLLGLATLCRPIALPLSLLFAGVAALIFRTPHRRFLHSAVVIACTALILLPWTMRCTVLSDRLVLVQGGSSVIFYAATRTDWNQKDQETLWLRFSTENPYGQQLLAAKTPREMAAADALGTRLAFQNIRSNPTGYVVSRLRNFPFLFITSFDIFTGFNKSFGVLYWENKWLALVIKSLLLLVFSLAPLLLALVGLLGDWRNPAVAFSSIVWIYTALANLPMWIEYRYWIAAVPFMLVSAAVGTQVLCVKFRLVKS